MDISFVQLMDLPNEILVIILKNLDNAHILYSLMDVNTRLNQIIYDPIFTTKIALMSPTDDILTQPSIFFNRFCLQILPKIHHKIKWLKLESESMERILLSADYPNLSQLDILITQKKPVLYFNGKNISFSCF
jgi:hypothetical protein